MVDAVQPGRLAGFLQSQKELFLADLKDGKGKGWTLAMGNEAGDLDTLASSIAYSCLSTLSAERSVPLVLTPASLMNLRPENLQAFKLSHIPLDSLLHVEALPLSTIDLATQGVNFALVDHNRLLPQFGDGKVVAVIDHHDDEGLYEEAQTRLIQVPTGSASSLVTKHFRAAWQAAISSPAGVNGSPIPAELATLLLTAILVDTGGLKAGGKATDVDYDSAAFLYSISTLNTGTNLNQSFTSGQTPPDLTQLTQSLLDAKMDVSHLSTHDLLLRDYKEYVLPTSSTSSPTVRVGLSTVPVGLKVWLGNEKNGWESYLASSAAYMKERNLDIEGVLTSYRSEKGNHKRELCVLVRVGGGIPSAQEAQTVLGELIDGLQAASELELGLWDKKVNAGDGLKVLVAGSNPDGLVGKVWEQGNAKATRKQVAPIMRDIIAKLV